MASRSADNRASLDDLVITVTMPIGSTERAIRLRGLRRVFACTPPVTAVAGANLEIGDGEFFSMLGPSGSRKTTVLRMIALLAFGLSFDEIVVTTFTAGPGSPTLPIWIFNNLFRHNQAPVVNVVAVVLVLVSILPVWAALRLGENAAAESRL